jgi:hypothetical protein
MLHERMGRYEPWNKVGSTGKRYEHPYLSEYLSQIGHFGHIIMIISTHDVSDWSDSNTSCHILIR